MEKIMCRYTYKSSSLGGSLLWKERPSYRSGLLSLANFGNGFMFEDYLKGSNGDDLARDWRNVGNDLRMAKSCSTAQSNFFSEINDDKVQEQHCESAR